MRLKLVMTLAVLVVCQLIAQGSIAQSRLTAPVVTLKSPATKVWETTDSSIDLQGLATGFENLSGIRWVTQAGRRGRGSWVLRNDGSADWAVHSVTLHPGINLITVMGVDASNRTASLNVAVNRKPLPTSQPALEVRLGTWRNRPIKYRVWKGLAVVDGDVLASLSSVAQRPQLRGVTAQANAIKPQGIAIDYGSQLWPAVGGVYEVPYVITGTSANLMTAIGNFNATFAGLIQFVSRSSESNYVDITVEGGGGEGRSWVGVEGGAQALTCGTGCSVATWLHEMGHTVGLLHEHQRPDRASFITLNLANADLPNVPGNFNLLTYDAQTLGLYDDASVMEYGAFDFSKAGLPVIESIPAGMPLGNDSGYSAGDIDQIERLYGAAPSAVTVTTNPTGLQIVVDGATYTAPQSFNWALGTSHTLVPAADPQTTSPADGSTYAFGAWNDLQSRSHTVTIAPGSGALTTPVNKPAVTMYEANFIRLQPFAYLSPPVYPDGAGSVSSNPAPTAEYGGSFFADRTLVQLTVMPTAGSGYSFYDWFNLPYPPSDNPHSFFIQSPTTSAQAVFVSTPVTIVGETLTGPNLWNPGVAGTVDGNFAYLPTAFSPTYDGTGWNATTTHTIALNQTQSPVTTNVFYNWNSWSDAGAISHVITQVGSGSQTIAASLTPYYATYTVPPALGDTNSACYGGVQTSPAGTSYAANSSFSFYADGASVTTTATANPAFPGMLFAGWSGSLTGGTNPQTVTIHDQFVPTGNFNTAAAPLTITGTSPGTVAATSNSMNLIVNGTGFSPITTYTYWNGSYRANSYTSPTQLTMQLAAGDLMTEGGQDIVVGNYSTNSANATCGVTAAASLVVTGPGPPAVFANPSTLAFANQVVGTKSAAKTVTVTNTSSSAVAVSSISGVGGTPSSFPETNTCGTSIAANASCTISVVFSPGSAGSRSTTLTVTDAAGTQTVALTGTAVAKSAIAVSPGSLTFGSQTVGTKSAAQVVTVSNSSAAAVAISSIAESGGTPTSFPETNTCGTSIAANSSCAISVVFSPGSAGSRTTTLTLTDAAGTQTVAVSGTAVAKSAITVSPTSVAFGNQTVGKKSAAKSITVKNSGSAAVSISSIADMGGTPTSFPQTNTCGSSLAGGASCTISVIFSPGSAGSRTTTLTLTDSAGTQTVALSGTAVAP